MTVTSRDIAEAVGWEWGTLRTNLRMIRAREAGWLVPLNDVHQGIRAEYADVERLVARAVVDAWPLDGYGVTYNTSGGRINDLRCAAADAVRADPSRRWLVVVADDDEPRAFTTDDELAVLGHGAAVVTRVRLDAVA